MTRGRMGDGRPPGDRPHATGADEPSDARKAAIGSVPVVNPWAARVIAVVTLKPKNYHTIDWEEQHEPTRTSDLHFPGFTRVGDL